MTTKTNHTSTNMLVATESRFRYVADMATKGLARDELWQIAEQQHGYITVQQASEQGIDPATLKQMAYRGTLEHPALEVYRFPKYPVTEADPYMLAVLWTRAPEAALSHETTLAVFGAGTVNPSVIHVTVGRDRRIRRAGGGQYEIHYQDLEPRQLTWWEEVPTVTLDTAILQCIDYGTPTYLLRQAIEEGNAQGRLDRRTQNALMKHLGASRG